MKRRTISGGISLNDGALIWKHAFEAAAHARLLADVGPLCDEVERLEQTCLLISEEPEDVTTHLRRDLVSTI